ncbi:hypothetical protein LINGRAHAP2_LOCUS10409 [Linum grandiflorum]
MLLRQILDLSLLLVRNYQGRFMGFPLHGYGISEGSNGFARRSCFPPWRSN